MHLKTKRKKKKGKPKKQTNKHTLQHIPLKYRIKENLVGWWAGDFLRHARQQQFSFP